MGLPGDLNDWKTAAEKFPPGTELYAVWDGGDKATLQEAVVEKVTARGVWITNRQGSTAGLAWDCRRVILPIEVHTTKVAALTAALHEIQAEIVAAQERLTRVEQLAATIGVCL